MKPIEALKGSRDSLKILKSQEDYAMLRPGLTCFVGVSGSGKSNLIANLLSRKDMLKGYFEEIYLICPSPSDIIMRHVNIPEKKYYDDLDEATELIKVLYNRNKNIPFAKAPNTLIIIDDSAHFQKFMKSKLMKKIAFSGTHVKLSTWICAQSLMRIDRDMRLNCHQIVIFHGTNHGEIERLMRDLPGNPRPYKEMLNIIKDLIKDKYAFIAIFNCNPDKTKNIVKNFQTRILL